MRLKDTPATLPRNLETSFLQDKDHEHLLSPVRIWYDTDKCWKIVWTFSGFLRDQSILSQMRQVHHVDFVRDPK